MIWFHCNQCGAVLSRPESASGALIFCSCGKGNVVPWDSTAAPPAPTDVGPVITATLIETTVPAAALRSANEPEAKYVDLAADTEQCFHHPEVAKSGECADCHLPFCADCLAPLAGRLLCAPCKNYRVVRQLRAPILPWPMTLALPVAFAGSLLCAFPAQFQAPRFSWFVLLALAPQLLALALGIWGLRVCDRDRRLSGWAMSLAAILAATTFAAVILVMGVAIPRMQG